MLQTAAKTAQMGDKALQRWPQTECNSPSIWEQLSEADRKKTRIVSKLCLQED